ncbi:FCD domain-containing protein [Streptomyces sp. NPDC056707]|uniref:FCD domain-containing protein n=1 Tax=Streptomyces sp. NPDC056707 TaxID=3345919 RepID=UPI0036B2CC4D
MVRTPADLARMRQALAAIDAAVAVGGDGAEEDLAFHRSIAESTGNAVMVSTVRYLGEVLRSGIRVTRANEARRGDFIEAVGQEHHAILAAVEAGAAEEARRLTAAGRGRRILDRDRGPRRRALTRRSPGTRRSDRPVRTR